MSDMKKILRNFIYKYDILFQFYYRCLYKPKENSIAGFIDNLSKNKKVHFIQIGANDGMYNDPLYKFIRRDNWEGILIEPQKNVFDRLKYNYRRKENLIFENVAIYKKSGYKRLYKIAFSDSDWASALSSFKRDEVESPMNAGYVEKEAKSEGIKVPQNREEYIVAEKVKCVTFEELIKKHNIKKIDLLLIDTEGYDFEIIKTINFQKVKPINIIYEHIHITNEEKRNCENYLKNLGYNLFIDVSDTLAYLKRRKGKETL